MTIPGITIAESAIDSYKISKGNLPSLSKAAESVNNSIREAYVAARKPFDAKAPAKEFVKSTNDAALSYAVSHGTPEAAVKLDLVV